MSETRDRTHALLTELGARAVDHIGTDLLTHLEGTEAILRRWGVPEHLAVAGLGHAVYSTDGFDLALLTLDERDRMVSAAGPEAEAVVYRYASCDRSVVHPQLGTRPLPFTDRFTGEATTLGDAEAEQFALLSAANELELLERGAVGPAGADAILAFVRDLAPHAPRRLGGY
jgi:hypothetical protein